MLAQPDQHVVATSRIPAATPELVEGISSHSRGAWTALNVSLPDFGLQLSATTAKYGRIDTLINNAGYAIGGVLETLIMESVRQQHKTNVFGPIRLRQSIIPAMRTSGECGIIVNVGSAEVCIPHAGATMYASAKWALEGLFEALTSELAVFNVRVLIAQPGGMRTRFSDPAKANANMTAIPIGYKGTMVDYVLQAVLANHKAEDLDPDKAALAVVQEVLEPTIVAGEGEGKGTSRPVMRLQLARECIGAKQSRTATLQSEAKLIENKALSCDYSAAQHRQDSDIKRGHCVGLIGFAKSNG